MDSLSLCDGLTEELGRGIDPAEMLASDDVAQNHTDVATIWEERGR